MTTIARSLVYLRRQGFVACVVEYWVPGVFHRRDAFGIGDLFAAHPVDRVVLLVQCATANHLPHCLHKAREIHDLAAWLRARGHFQLHGWRKRNDRWQVKGKSADMEPVVIRPAVVAGEKSNRYFFLNLPSLETSARRQARRIAGPVAFSWEFWACSNPCGSKKLSEKSSLLRFDPCF